MGDLGGGKFKAQTGGEGVSVDRGARNKPKTKREGAEEEKKRPQKHPRGIPLIDPGPSLGRNVSIALVKPVFLLAPLGWSKVFLGGSGGALGGPTVPPEAPGGSPGGLGGALGGSLGCLGAALGGRGGLMASTFGEQAALHNHLF